MYKDFKKMPETLVTTALQKAGAERERERERERRKSRGIEGWPFKRDRGLEGWKDSLLEGWKTRGLEGWQFNVSQFKLNFTNIAFLNSHTSIPPYLHTSNKRYAFTMAEILISLTIIGIIAAITLPSLTANINEKTWASQRKALYSRMTQALSMLPSLNGYGATGEQSEINEKAAQAFISDGLSKVLQINNICDSTKLSDCGIPEKITVMGTNSKMNFPTNLTELNPMFTSTYTSGTYSYTNPQSNINTNTAAFETKNGESVAVFYNPYCQPDMGETSWHYSQPKMCADFVFDLNGRKGPNKVGKDIGFITALYPTDSEIVMPIPLEKNAANSAYKKQTEAAAACRAQDENSRLPNRDELTALFYNKGLIGISSGYFWSGSVVSSSTAWNQNFYTGTRIVVGRSISRYVRCVKR